MVHFYVNIILFVFVVLKSEARAVYEQNPFLSQNIPLGDNRNNPSGLAKLQTPPPIYQQSVSPSNILNSFLVEQQVPLRHVTPPHVTIQSEFTGITKLRSLCVRARGQFQSEKCNQYVNCWDDSVIEQTCPEGLAFNPAGYCDFIQNVDCSTRSLEVAPITSVPDNEPTQGFATSVPASWASPVQPEATNSQPTYISLLPAAASRLQSKCLQTRGQFPTDACETYVDCWDNQVVEQNCPPGLYFSEKGYCDYAHNVNCYNRTLVKASIIIAKSQCPQPDGIFRDKTNCSRFLTCIANVVVGTQECPTGLRFNNVNSVCDYDYQVNCDDELHTNQAETPLYPPKFPAEPSLIEKTSPCPQPEGIFRDKTSCNKFFTCIANVVVATQECPPGLRFNNVNSICDYDYNVDCELKETVNQLQTTTFLPLTSAEMPASTSLECKPGKVFRLNTDCSSAILCRKEMTEVIHCPNGLTYDAPTDRCLHPTLAKCNDF